MSGGVDSAAAAQLALDAGDEVVAVTLELWADPATDGEQELLLARRPCSARAPSPTAWASRTSRSTCASASAPRWWTTSSTATPPAARRTRACAATARFASTRCSSWPTSLGAARLATGHYARIARDEHGPLVRAATDPRKDQSYMLAKLDPALLDRLCFPLGGLTKDAVRALARDAGLPVADKRESQDLCFVAGLGGRAFLQRHGGPRLRTPGEIVDRQGRVLGRHEGQHDFTVGPAPRPRRVDARAAVRAGEGRRARNRVVVGPERGARHHAGASRGRHAFTARRTESRSVRLRYHADAAPLPGDGAATDRLELELERPAAGRGAGAARLPDASRIASSARARSESRM